VQAFLAEVIDIGNAGYHKSTDARQQYIVRSEYDWEWIGVIVG
jgi:hypothetical protein